MKICIPAVEANGLQSVVEPHFPQAPYLLVFDTETRVCHTIDVAAERGDAPEDTVVDAVICGSLNRMTLRQLLDQGIQVFGSAAQTVAEAVAQFEAGELQAVAAAGGCCGGQDHADAEHGCCSGQGDEEHECCGGKGHDDPDHECCGGRGHDDPDHECCGGKGHADDEHECCGGKGHGHQHKSEKAGCGCQD